MYGHKIVASANNIPTTYDETAGSLAINGAPSAGHVEIINTTNSVLAVTKVPGSSSAPSSTITVNRAQAYIPAAPTGGSAGWVKDSLKIAVGDKVYLRSDSGSAVTTGTVYFNLY